MVYFHRPTVHQNFKPVIAQEGGRGSSCEKCQNIVHINICTTLKCQNIVHIIIWTTLISIHKNVLHMLKERLAFNYNVGVGVFDNR